MMQFKIEEKFEVPLHLLLKMIEKEELDITEISLSKIADEYVTYIKEASDIQPEDMADFLVVAARLLLIKSRALLPYLYPDEEEEIEEFREQLKMYKEYLDAAKYLQKMLGKKKFMFGREFNRRVVLQNTQIFSPPKKLKQDDMKMVMNDLINRLAPAFEQLEEEKLEHKIRIEDRIISIQQKLLQRMQFSFNSVLDNSGSKTEVIVTFLAVLELNKQRSLSLEQGGLFEEITINRQEGNIPTNII